MITEAHNYTLINTLIYGMDNEYNTGIKRQSTHKHTMHLKKQNKCSYIICLPRCKANVKCMAGNDDVKLGRFEPDGGTHMGLSVRVITLLRL